MNILILTQKVDKFDPVLGFFHRWLEEFAKNYKNVTVICLGKGKYELPQNVKVLSLGKEEGRSKIKYLRNFYKYIWQERSNYEAVFVHMNQEYIVLGGLLWLILGKKVYFWRNHAKGSFLTNLAVHFSHKVFCTSPQSYTARFSKTELMPAGIDTNFFKPNSEIKRVPKSILFLGRIAPVKKVSEFIDWLLEREFNLATIAGEALPKDALYKREMEDKVLEHGLSDKVKFIGPVTQDEALKLYQSHETYVNLTPSGSLDKTILEAAACETNVIVANEDLKLLENLKQNELREFVVKNHSLSKLINQLTEKICQKD